MAKRRLPKFLRAAEVVELEANARCDRDRMIVRAGRYLGLRVSELVKLRKGDIDLEERQVFVDQGKGGKDRYVPIPSAFFPEFAAYVRAARGPWLFPGRKRKDGQVRPLTTRAVQYLVGNAAARGGVTRIRVSPHKLRHTYATEVLRKTGDIRVVQELLGHANIQTTTIYAAVVTEKLREAVDLL